MPSFIRNPKDFWIGIMFLVFGALAVYIAQDYSMGRAGKMGPAYFPTVLGWILIALGAIGVVRAFIVHGEPIGHLAVMETLKILGAVVLFGILVRNAGLALAVFVLVIASAMASTRFRLMPTVIIGAGLALFSVLVFVKLLGLPLPVIGPWLGAQ